MDVIIGETFFLPEELQEIAREMRENVDQYKKLILTNKYVPCSLGFEFSQISVFKFNKNGMVVRYVDGQILSAKYSDYTEYLLLSKNSDYQQKFDRVYLSELEKFV